MRKTYFRILSFARPIEKYAIPYFFYTLFHTIFHMLNLALIVPILNLLFNKSEVVEVVTELPAFQLKMEYLQRFMNYQLYRIYGENYDVIEIMIALAILLSVAALFSNFFRYMGQRTIENMRARTLYRIRNDVYNNVMGLNVGFFSNERKGDLISKITSDVQVLEFSITNTLQVAFREPFLIIGYLVMMMAFSANLTAFSVLYLPVVGLIIVIISKRLRKPARDAQIGFGNMTTVLDESFSGMKIVKGYNAEGYFKNKFNLANWNFAKTTLSIYRRQQLASPLSEFMGIAAMGGLLIYGAHLVVGGSLGGAEFIAFIGVFSQITRPIRAFTDGFSTINRGIAAGERVLELMDTVNTVSDKPDAMELGEFSDKIEFRNVDFSYENKEILKNINFTVHKGETVALVGPSGGGKSTISDLIPRFYDVLAGEVLIDGVNVKDYTSDSIRKNMGLVSQDTVLFNDSIENNIRLGNDKATFVEVENAAKIANAHNFILETEQGYETNIGDRGMKLSGGQRQRLSIARAVLKNPPILILDEATSALDTESEKLVQEALNSLLKGRTSLVIAHRLSTIYNADKILVVEEGRIVEQGKHQELIDKQGLYSKLVEMQLLN